MRGPLSAPRSTLLTSPALRLAFAGGGTGGHIVPGMHVLSAAAQPEAPEIAPELLWFTSGRAVEERVLADVDECAPGVEIRNCVLPLEPSGGGAPSLRRLGLRLPPAVLRARAELKKHGTDVLFGLGGFTTAPAVVAARTLRIPVGLLEINAVAGRATRVLGRLSQRVFHAWPSTLPSSGGERHRQVGPPVAHQFRATRDAGEAREALGFDPRRPLLCVLGGSQGALALNDFVRRHLKTLVGGGISVLHQVGPGRAAEAGGQVAGYKAVEYVRDVPTVLAAADLALCRGGASTLAELAVARTPAWVVPYEGHADRHQAHNANQLGAGARVVPESALQPSLASELVRFLGLEGELERASMRAGLEERVPDDAALRILDELAKLRR